MAVQFANYGFFSSAKQFKNFSCLTHQGTKRGQIAELFCRGILYVDKFNRIWNKQSHFLFWGVCFLMGLQERNKNCTFCIFSHNMGGWMQGIAIPTSTYCGSRLTQKLNPKNSDILIICKRKLFSWRWGREGKVGEKSDLKKGRNPGRRRRGIHMEVDHQTSKAVPKIQKSILRWIFSQTCTIMIEQMHLWWMGEIHSSDETTFSDKFKEFDTIGKN